METTDLNIAEILEIDITILEPKDKHPTIFYHFDLLNPGDALYLLNDHDPKPLYYQMLAIRGNGFSWKYEQKGPGIWKVLITKTVVEDAPTIGELAAEDIRKAEVFRKYGLEFCCGGKKTLKQACIEKNIDIEVIEKELQQAIQKETKTVSLNAGRWELDFLVDYIYNEHHTYWYQEEPGLTALLVKVAGEHGNEYVELQKLYELYKNLRSYLNAHMATEERVLFPHIKELVQAKKNNAVPLFWEYPEMDRVGTHLLEEEHETTGEILGELCNITNNFTPPEDACRSFALLYYKLKCLAEDLQQHVHLENNILFPKAACLEKELAKVAQ